MSLSFPHIFSVTRNPMVEVELNYMPKMTNNSSTNIKAMKGNRHAVRKKIHLFKLSINWFWLKYRYYLGFS